MRYAPVSLVAAAVLLFITFTFVTEQTAQSKSDIYAQDPSPGCVTPPEAWWDGGRRWQRG
jgi:hypothetical protein